MSTRHPIREASVEAAEALFRKRHMQACSRTDRIIAFIMSIQWLGAVVAAYFISPQTWEGVSGSIHPHVVAALYLGALVSLPPIYLTLRWSGDRFIRHVIAACQMLMSALLIHITGGRIETHFHIFGSLAFLAFYLEWEVLLTATIVTIFHHALFGYFLPMSIFGTGIANNWRFVEHAFWVVFFDMFLVIPCLKGLNSLRQAAKREADHIYRSHHDPLTCLGNRTLMQKTFDDMSDEFSTRRELAFLVMDLDKFKQVNDTLGHQIGDEVLIEASRRIEAILGPNNMLARMGGDEFAAIISNHSSLLILEELAARIVSSVTEPIVCGEHLIHIGVSIGICRDDGIRGGLAELLHCADLALYKAKNTGRNRYLVFEEEMRARSLKEMSLEYRLRNAIAQEAFELHYQPIVSIDGVLLGFEALLRWNDGTNGQIPPNEFLPLAEATGLVVPLGEWVIRKACAQAAEWHRTGNRLMRMSVNVTAKQLTSESFVGNLLHCLLESGLPPELLCLEITDSVLIRNYDEIAAVLRLLNLHGVNLSIDDFETSQSAWTYPAELPIDTLKIDRRITTGMSASDGSLAVVEELIRTAHSLQLRVLAKGVETREQLEWLRELDCDEIQGFHISCAISPESATALMNTSLPAAPLQAEVIPIR